MEIERRSVFFGFTRFLIFVFLYILVGAIFYSLVLQWDVFDSLYFEVVSLSTTGYGDFVPRTDKERIFTSFFLVVGVFVFGGFLTSQAAAVAAHAERTTNDRNLRTAQNMQETGLRGSSFFIDRLRRMSREVFKSSAKPSAAAASLASIHELENENENETGYEGDDADNAGGHASSTSSSGMGASQRPAPSNDYLRSGAQTEEMKKTVLLAFDQDIVDVRNKLRRDCIIVAATCVVGMLSMMSLEQWSTTVSFYWVCQTITSVGYGDVVPNTNGGRAFTIFFILFGCFFLAKTITDFIEYPLLLRARRHEKRLLDQFEHLTEAKLQYIFQSDMFTHVPNLRRSDKELSKAEFVLLVLQMMAKVQAKDLLMVASLFDRLDAGGAGVLSQAVMAQRINEAQQRDTAMAAMRSTPNSGGSKRRGSFQAFLTSVTHTLMGEEDESHDNNIIGIAQPSLPVMSPLTRSAAAAGAPDPIPSPSSFSSSRARSPLESPLLDEV
jgi:hypothetical protein